MYTSFLPGNWHSELLMGIAELYKSSTLIMFAMCTNEVFFCSLKQSTNCQNSMDNRVFLVPTTMVVVQAQVVRRAVVTIITQVSLLSIITKIDWIY